MIEETIQSLNKNGFEAKMYATAYEAAAAVLEIIPEGAEVGMGGSVTSRDMGLDKMLKERGNQVHWHWTDGAVDEVYKKAYEAPYYICSANAVTMDGRIINIDGRGNRVSAMIAPHNTLILVAGRNKIAQNYETAMERIKSIACPWNARRLNKKTPCAARGECNDCDSPDRMCVITLMLERCMRDKKIYVLLVDEDLGY